MEDDSTRSAATVRRILLTSIPILLASVLSWEILTSISGPISDFPPFQPPFGENDARGMGPFWHNYGAVMTGAEDFDDWFTDVDAATRTIQVMLNVIPLPKGAEENVYEYVRRHVESRATQVKLAYDEWRRFLDGRERLVRDMVTTSGTSHIYVNGRPVDSITAAKLRNWRYVDNEVDMRLSIQALGGDIMYFNPRGDSYRNPERKEIDAPDPLDGQSVDALKKSGRAVTQELVRTHTELFREWDPVQAHIREALKAEQTLLRMLRQASPKWHLWTPKLATALPTLLKRMEGLQGRHVTMGTTLERLQKRFPGGQPEFTGDQPGMTEDQDGWLETAKELLRGWATVLMDAQEGVLLMLRQRDIRSQIPSATDLKASWEAWKGRNCGDTSCYSKPGLATTIKKFFGVSRTAEVAQDEVSWLRSLGGDAVPKIWRGVYEVACCGDRELAHCLEQGKKQVYG
ncbi:hypothetical protein GGR58DRAFT_330759 [Xylaria digitata]|nr:hypothetical protein GGR58DRAFT_330759 [Xylaria digitata]